MDRELTRRSKDPRLFSGPYRKTTWTARLFGLTTLACFPKPSRNHPEALLTALKRKSGHRPTEQQDQTKTKPQERATKPSVSVFQRFNQKKACPTTPSSLSAHTLILPFTLITETNCYNILYITYYILYIIINNTTIGERKGKTTPRLYLH